jgi:predicted RNase H-like HicB family nuclease
MAGKKTTYVVRFERSEPGWWHVSVPSVPGCHTQARSLQQGRARIREALGLFVEGAETAELVDEPRLPREARTAVARAARVRRRAEDSAREAAEETLAADGKLADLGLSLRDRAALLGVSFQRIAQLAVRHRGERQAG